MSRREVQESTYDERGEELHPAFGVARVSRWTSTPGAVLFDSDVRHAETMVVTVERATRKRDLNRDWIHGENRPLIEFQFSAAQWGAFVSSFGQGGGVPCTLLATETDRQIPGMPFAPRLAESTAEVHGAADRAFGAIKEAMARYEATPATPKKAKDAALRGLHFAIENATSNVDFAADSLVEHTENVVAKARADIEAMVTNRARALGLTAEQAAGMEPLALDDGSRS